MYYFSEEELKRVESLLNSKKLFRYQGAEVKSQSDYFEEEFSRYISPNSHIHSIILNSGTSALVNALATLQIGIGDEVIIPSYTFVATALAVLEVGATPIIAEIDETLTVDVKSIESKITKKTKAIIPVHIDGLICSMKKIDLLAKNYNLAVIEDVAQAIGGKYKNSYAGTIGNFGCFSLNVDKIITAGEGGILITRDDKHYQNAFSFHDPASQFGPTMRGRFKNQRPTIGRSMRVSEITSAIASAQLLKLETILGELREIKAFFIEEVISKLKLPPFIPLGHDAKGDCSISFHLKLKNVEDTVAISKVLLTKEIIATPLTTRLAHFSWQWKSILQGQYRISDSLNTIDLASRTLRISIDRLWSQEEREKKVSLLIDVLQKYGY